MDGADDGVLRHKTATINRLDPGCAAIGDFDARHIGIGEDFAAVVPDAGDQGIGQLPAPPRATPKPQPSRNPRNT